MANQSNKRTSASDMALGGVLAALAVVIMSLGSLIPAATFICPMLAMILLSLFLKRSWDAMGWTWYAAVAILSVLLAPDKEAAAVFVFLGYYPILKPKIDKLPLRWLWKAILFNVLILSMYWALINLFGMAQVAQEFGEMGIALTLVTLVLGNATFFMLDVLLGMKLGKKHG